MFRKPLFWIILIIIIAIICFIFFGHRHSASATITPQTTRLLLPDQKQASKAKKDQHYLIEKNLAEKAINTPEKETAILNLPNVPTQTYIPPQNQAQNAPQSANPPGAENNSTNSATPANNSSNPSNTNTAQPGSTPLPSNPPT